MLTHIHVDWICYGIVGTTGYVWLCSRVGKWIKRGDITWYDHGLLVDQNYVDAPRRPEPMETDFDPRLPGGFITKSSPLDQVPAKDMCGGCGFDIDPGYVCQGLNCPNYIAGNPRNKLQD